MATALMSLQRCCRRASLLLVARRPWSSSPAATPSLRTRLLLFLSQHYYDVETLLSWTSRFKDKGLRRKNALYSYTQRHYGDNIATAYFILCLKGRFRYAGQSEWFCPDHRGKFSWDFMKHKDTPIEEVDVSHKDINYFGLENLVKQRSLRTLSLRGCPEVDDWFLSRLHVFQDTLEELDISHCPRVTVGGLAALRNLKGLRRLDVSALPGIASPGLVIILLEEMLPCCQVTATGYNHTSLTQEQATATGYKHTSLTQEQATVTGYNHTSLTQEQATATGYNHTSLTQEQATATGYNHTSLTQEQATATGYKHTSLTQEQATATGYNHTSLTQEQATVTGYNHTSLTQEQATATGYNHTSLTRSRPPLLATTTPVDPGAG